MGHRAGTVAITIGGLAAGLAACLGGAPVSAASAARGGDPLFARQWALSDPAALGAPAAWSQSRGAGVVVAVVDGGAQPDHPDLSGRLWTNPGEIPGNGVDDDANGYVDDVNGANVLTGDGDIRDRDGHGTHVAGIIAARAGNGRGGAGIAPAARVMVVKVFDRADGATTGGLAAGIRYAVGAGARILNVSLNGDRETAELADAVRHAGARGATIVASAGNHGRDIDALPSYPAASADAAVLTVTAGDRRGALLALGNRGARSVDLAAPGESILSTTIGSRYERRHGTSMAAPLVAGSLALLAAARPDLGQPALRDALLQGAARRRLAGAPRLDVAAAMHRVLPGARWRSRRR